MSDKLTAEQIAEKQLERLDCKTFLVDDPDNPVIARLSKTIRELLSENCSLRQNAKRWEIVKATIISGMDDPKCYGSSRLDLIWDYEGCEWLFAQAGDEIYHGKIEKPNEALDALADKLIEQKGDWTNEG